MKSLDIITIPVTEFSQNARIIACTTTREAIFLDPGGEVPKILKRFGETDYTIKAIWLTHSHLDHVGGVLALKEKYSVPLYAHPGEKMLRQRLPELAAMYGLPAENYPVCPEPDSLLYGGEELSLGKLKFKVLFTPGHSPGHLCFYCDKEATLLAGDLVFAGSVGRTDFPGCDHNALLNSITTQILTLPDETKILPGHGLDTTVGAERNTNPFFPR